MFTKFVSQSIFLDRVQQQNWIKWPTWIIDGLDLDEVGEMDTDKSGSNEKSPRDKGKGPEQTPPTKQGRGNHEGSGGSRTKTDSAQNTSDIAAYIMEAVQQEGITEEQVFQLLREMELVDEVGDFI